MLSLQDIFTAEGISHRDILLIRHTENEQFSRSSLNLESAVLKYTAEQAVVGKFPKSPPPLWVVFLAEGGFQARLYTVYENLGEIDRARTEVLKYYSLGRSGVLEEYRHRLSVDWGRDAINWVKSGSAAARMPVLEISDGKAVEFPGYDRVTLNFSELRDVVSQNPKYSTWRTALSAVQGIYLISDRATGKLYVGKADGSERILGRWDQYARTKHGGNKALQTLMEDTPDSFENFQFSILRVFGPSEPSYVVGDAEKHFKEILLSRKFGYNLN